MLLNTEIYYSQWLKKTIQSITKGCKLPAYCKHLDWTSKSNLISSSSFVNIDLNTDNLKDVTAFRSSRWILFVVA